MKCVICFLDLRANEWCVPMAKPIVEDVLTGRPLKEEHGYAHSWHFQNTEWDDDDD